MRGLIVKIALLILLVACATAPARADTPPTYMPVLPNCFGVISGNGSSPITCGNGGRHVTNLAGLRAVVPVVGATAIRDGYAAAGDAPWLTYTWFAACPGTPDNIALYVAPLTGGAGCWSAAKDPNVSNVLEWGAVDIGVGNVTGTDSTAAVTAALSWCGNTIGRLTVPPIRVYVGSASLIVPPGCTVRSDAPADPEVTDYSGDYTKVRGALLIDPKFTIINTGGHVENLYLLNSTSLTANPNTFRAVLSEAAAFSPAVHSVVVTASAFNSHASFAWTAHGLKVNSPVRFSGSMPSGLFDGSKQIYFVAAEGFSADSFEVSTFPGTEPINTGASGTVSGQFGSVGYWQGPTFHLTANGQSSGRDSALTYSSVIGFDVGVADFQGSRGLLDYVNVDANTCFHSVQSFDWASRRMLRCEGFISNGPAFDAPGDQFTSVSAAASGSGGACLLTTPTANYLTGDTVWATNVGGLPSCNGRFTATVVDSTHLLLQGSKFAGGSYTTAFWTAGYGFIEGVNGLNWGTCNVGSAVTGANVPANSTILAVNYAQGKIEIDKNFVASLSGQTITCGNAGYTTGGSVYQSTYWRPGPAFAFLDETGGSCVDCFANGHRTGYYVGDGAIAFGVEGLNLLEPNVDGINDLVDLDSYGVEIAGHTQGVTVSSGPVRTVGVGLYIHASGSTGYTNHFIGVSLNSNLGNGTREGILWDISSAGNTITGGGSRGSPLRAWFNAGAINTTMAGFNGPTVTVSTQAPAPSLSVLRSAGNILAGGYVNNTATLDATAFGAVCDGVANDYTALQAWASSAGDHVALTLPPGKCLTGTAPIRFPTVSHYSVTGRGPTTSSIVYTGGATAVDILQLGVSGGSAFYGASLRGFNIGSNTTMTGGYALHAMGMSSATIQDVFADAWNTGDNNGKLCGGYWLDGVFAVDIINPNTSSAQACGDGLKVNHAGGFSPGSAEVRIFGGNIGGNPGGLLAGLHMAGGFGGLRCDGTNIAANQYGLLVDNAQVAVANREFAQGSTCVFDNNTLAGVKINDALIDGGSGGAGGTIDLAGWTSSTTTGHGIEIDAWKNSDVEIRGNKVYNNCGSGVYVTDSTTYVKVDGGVSINNNGNPAVSGACPAWQAGNPGHGFGIEASVSTSKIFSFASMWGNAGGNTNANSNTYDWTQQGAGLLALSGNGDVQFGLNAIQTLHAASFYFLRNGTKNWQLGMDTDDTFKLWDAANGFATAIKFTTLGNIDIGEGAGTTLNLKVNALQVNGTAGVSCSVGTVSAVTMVVTNGVVTHC